MSRYVLPHIRRLRAYTPGEQPGIANWVKLNTNENPYGPSPRVLRALKKAVNSRLRLYPDPASTSLRRVIARRNRCGPDRVFIGNGSDEILALCLRAFAGERGKVQFPSPSYSLYPVLVQIQNARPNVVEFNPRYGMAPASLDRHAAVTFIANPNAPSGTWISPRVLAGLARRLRGVLVVDEAYVDFAAGNCARLALRTSNVLVTRSFSKSYSLAGMRIGYALGHSGLVDALFKVKDSYNVDRLAQIAAEEAFQDRAYLRRMVGRIRWSRERLARRLRERGWEVVPSAANFLFARPAGPQTAAAVFAGLRKRKVLVRHFPGRRTGAYLRISIGTDKEIDFLLRALQALGA